MEGIVSFLSAIDFPTITLSHLYACLSIFRQDLSYGGVAKNSKFHMIFGLIPSHEVKGNNISA